MLEKKIRSTILGVCMLVIAFACTACSESKFSGNKVCNDNEFVLEYTAFNTTYEHSFDLEEGDAIHCSITADKGKLDIIIQKDEINAYQGNDVLAGEFDVIIEEAGRYTITVTGKSAAGSVSFKKMENEVL